MKAAKTMHVDAKPERVMSFFVDWTATPAGVTMKPIYESADVVGNSYEWTFKVLGIPRNGVSICTEYVPAERIAFRDLGAMKGASSVTIEPDNGGSKVTYEMDSHVGVPLIGRFFDPMLKMVWERNVEWGKREIENPEKVEKTAA